MSLIPEYTPSSFKLKRFGFGCWRGVGSGVEVTEKLLRTHEALLLCSGPEYTGHPSEITVMRDF